VVGDFRGLVRAFARSGDELCSIAGPGCPYTLPIGGRPLISHAVKSLCDAGAREILVTVDSTVADVVVPAIGHVKGAEVDVVIQPQNDEAASIRAVHKVLGPGPLAVFAGDALVPDAIELKGDTVWVAGGTPVAWTLSETPEDRLTAGRGAVVELEGAWRYDGTVDGVLEANTIALDGLKRGRVGVDMTRASVQGRVQIDPSVELDGAKLRGPVWIGPGARLIETYVGPYTSIGAGVTLEGVEIEHSIVLPGAQIRYPGRRLEASLVGEGAQIGRDYSLPSALRLRVGPNAEIQLS
jgi:NDP-sugar pyrophosphorylase family protein